MEDLPNIPFIREGLSHLSEEQIKEEERRFYNLCLLLKEIHQKQKLTDKNHKLQ